LTRIFPDSEICRLHCTLRSPSPSTASILPTFYAVSPSQPPYSLLFTPYCSLFQFNRQGDRESGALADFAFGDDLATHYNDEFFDDRQAQSGAAVLARARHVG